MRKLIVSTLCLLAAVPAAPAQSAAPPVTSWIRVTSLAPGANLHISARGGGASCRFQSADADTLTCAKKDGSQPKTFQRVDVRKIITPHRGRSTLAGLGIGAGAGVILGVATGDPAPKPGQFVIINFTKGDLALLFGTVLGVVGAAVGALTDFTHSVVYKAK